MYKLVVGLNLLIAGCTGNMLRAWIMRDPAWEREWNWAIFALFVLLCIWNVMMYRQAKLRSLPDTSHTSLIPYLEALAATAGLMGGLVIAFL